MFNKMLFVFMLAQMTDYKTVEELTEVARNYGYTNESIDAAKAAMECRKMLDVWGKR